MMSASLSRIRALSGGLDQVFSSASNGLMIFAVAVVTDVKTFGRVAILITALVAVLGCLRGALGTPLMLKADQSREQIRREGSYALTTSLLMGPALSALILALGPDLGRPAILLAIAAPFVLAQDVLRYVVITEGRPHIAALWDGIWCLGTVMLLVFTWTGLHFATTAFVLGGWTALAVAAFVGIFADLRLLPRVRGFARWARAGWRHRLRYGIDAGLDHVTVFIILTAVTALVSATATAALRGATAVLAPIGMFGTAVQLVVIPESTRLSAQPQQVWRALLKLATIVAFISALAGLILFALPTDIGRFLLGDSWPFSQQILPLIALEYVAGCYLVVVAIFLRTFNRSAETLTLKIGSMVAMIAGATIAALAYQSAIGVAIGIAVGSIAATSLAYAWFAPWQPRARAQSVDIAAPDIATAKTSLVADNDITQAMPHGDAGKPGQWRFVRAFPPARPTAPPSWIGYRRTTVPTSTALIAIWTFVVMAVVVPIVILELSDPWSNLLWVGPLLIIAIASARFAWIMATGERRLSEMMFWAFTYAFMGLAPMAQLLRDLWPLTVPRTDSSLVWPASLIVIVGLLAFLGGIGADRVISIRRGAPEPSASKSGRPKDGFTISYHRLMLLTAGSVALNLYYLSRTGFIQFLKSREESSESLDNLIVQGNFAVVLRAASYMTLLVAWVALVRFRREANRAARNGAPRSRTVMNFNLVLILFVGLLVANSLNPISNARYLSGTAVLAVAAALGLFATSLRFRLSAYGFLLGLLVIFPQADAFRYARDANVKLSDPIESVLSPDYDSFAQVVNGYLVATRDGIDIGKQALGIMLFWIPRMFWSDKPVDTGIYIANSRGYFITNLSAPLWIELFLNGGWIVLVLGMFVIGYLLHRWDTKLERDLQLFGMPSVLGSILPFYLMILLRGSVLQAAPYLVFTVVSWWFIARRQGRSAHASPSVRAPAEWISTTTAASREGRKPQRAEMTSV